MDILRLPSTILYDIFVLVQESQSDFLSRHDLRNFAVVHRSWSDPAARVMDRVLAINTCFHDYILRNLVQKLSTSSMLADRIGRAQFFALDVWPPHQVHWDAAAHLVRKMPNLRRFRVVTYNMRGESGQAFYRLCEAFESVESLRELICVGLSELSLASFFKNAVSHVQYIHTLVLHCLRETGTAIDWERYPHWPPIQRLSLHSIVFDDTELFATLVSKTLPSLLELELVQPQWLTRGHWNPEELGSAIKEVAKSERGLQSLRMSLPRPIVRSTPLVEAIAECRYMRSLQLEGIPRSSDGQFISYLHAPLEFLFVGAWDGELARELEENLRPGGTLRPHLRRLLIAEDFLGTPAARLQGLSILSRACVEAGVQLRFCTNFLGTSGYFGEGMWGSAPGPR